MKDVINSLDRLDVILDIVESSILEAEDNAINLISTQNSIITNDIKSLINERITVYKKLNFISDNSVKKQNAPDNLRQYRKAPRTNQGKLDFLKGLLKSRLDLTTQISPIFSSGNKPRIKDINQIIDKLVSQGVIVSDKKIVTKKK